MKRAILACLLLWSIGTAEEFSDDFSSGASAAKWLANSDAVTLTVNDGECTVVNPDSQFSGFAFHSISETPDPFTLSGTVRLTDPGTQSAGFICCLATTGMPTGYYVSIARNELVVVDKVGSTGTGTNIVTQPSPYITTGANHLLITRRNNEFRVACNGHYVATFTDDDFTSGSIALQVSVKTTAVFDDIVFINKFTDITPPTCFSDDFDDGDLVGWGSFGSDNVTVENRDSAMWITTDEGDTYEVIDLPTTTLVLRATISHRGGSTANLYGLFLSGVGESTLPLTGFGITAGRNYAVFSAGENIQLTPTTTIKGAAYVEDGDTVWYTDTLEVLRRDGSDEYLFIVNGDTLSRHSGVSFDVTSAGVFCMDSMALKVDDFLLTKDENGVCPVNRVFSRRAIPRGISAPTAGARQFDLLGRSVMLEHRMNTRFRNGLYIRRVDGRSVRRMHLR